MRDVIYLQTEEYPDDIFLPKQEKLNRLYDQFKQKYGYINSRGNSLAFWNDRDYPLLCSLEIFDDENNFVRKADMFTKRTIRPIQRITHVDTAREALLVSLNELGRVDIRYMSDLAGIEPEALLLELRGKIFKNPLKADANDPLKGYETAEEYLSGNQE